MIDCPDITIIIPVYNAMPLLERTLHSVFTQHTNFSFEVILVDDGSTDDSVAYIKSRKEPNIILIEQANAGPATARNRGVEVARGRYCAYLDADDYWMDGFVEQTVSFLDRHPGCVAVNVAQKHITLSGEGIAPRCIGRFSNPFVLDDFFGFWGEWMHVCTGSVVIRTEVMNQTGGQRTDLRVTEDLEYWALLSTYGRWGFIPQVLMVSDGTDLVNGQQDWMRKMMPRWMSTPSVEEWEKRIVVRFGLASSPGFARAEGRIASMLVYGHIMSGRTTLGRQTVGRYGSDFPASRANRVMRLASTTPLTWWLLCKWIQRKEQHRFKKV